MDQTIIIATHDDSILKISDNAYAIENTTIKSIKNEHESNASVRSL